MENTEENMHVDFGAERVNIPDLFNSMMRGLLS